MELTRTTARLILVCGLFTSAACDDPLRPEDVPGTYLLRTLRGDPLPAVLWESGGARMRVLADSLVLNADGTGYAVSHTESTNHLRTTVGRVERPLRYEVRDDRLEGTYLCPPGAACLAMIQPLRGEFTAIGFASM